VGDDRQDLSHEELVALLQAAAAADAGRAARYSKQELLQAAEELRIDPATAGEFADQYLARRAALVRVPRPFDTRITLQAAPDQLELTIPPLALGRRALAPFATLLPAGAFVGFWTHQVAATGSPLVWFGIPFGLAIVALGWRFAQPLLRTTRVTLRRDRGTIRIGPLGRTISVRPSELRARVGEHDRQRALILEHGVRTFALMEGRSDREQDWVESELRRWLLASNPL